MLDIHAKGAFLAISQQHIAHNVSYNTQDHCCDERIQITLAKRSYKSASDTASDASYQPRSAEALR